MKNITYNLQKIKNIKYLEINVVETENVAERNEEYLSKWKNILHSQIKRLNASKMAMLHNFLKRIKEILTKIPDFL